MTSEELYDIHERRLADMDATIDNGMRLYAFEWKLGLLLILLIVLIGNVLIVYFADSGMDRFLSIVGALALNVGGALFAFALRAIVRGWMNDLLAAVTATTAQSFEDLEAGLAEL